MAAECLSAIHCCRVRITRLDSLGSPVAGPNNVYVTDKPIQVGVTPVVQAGDDKTLVGGCDCIVAQYKGYDKLKYWTFELDLGQIEPGLLEMLTGGAVILDGGDPIGLHFPTQAFDCSAAVQPNVCFEAWQDLWEEDHQSSDYPFLHWVWPSSFWQFGAQTLQNDFLQPKLTGFSRGNDNWGEGIFGDTPEAVQALGDFFYTDEVPDAACGYQSYAVT
jgi:hypothetical protein